MFQARIHISVIRAPLCIPHSWQIKRWSSLLKKTCNLCSMFILNNSKVWLIETVLFEMPYGRSTAQMVCVDVVWGTTVVTYGTNHNMDTCSLQILALSCFVNYNSESIQTHWLSCLFVFLSTTMQYVIYTYMKHLGVRVKEPRSLESKRLRISFLPMIKVI